MTVYERRGHWRTTAIGTTHWVSAHMVRRDHWDIQWLQGQFGSAIYRASDFLRRSNVGRGAQGCFVNPNAKCPVCGVPVFFYQNSLGSRVYFDDLGPPWPKHPCTDNLLPRRGIVHAPWKPITRRTKGEIREIIEEANKTGLLRNKRFGEYTSMEWSLVLVEEVQRSGDLNTVSGCHIESSEHQSIKFSCYSEQPLFEPGDFVSVRDREFSFFDKRTMTAITFNSGERIIPTTQLSSEQQSNGAPEPSEQEKGTGRTEGHPKPFNPQQFHRRDMKAHERVHFHRKERLHRAFVNRLRHIIEPMLPEGTRTPEQFAVRLNARGERTAANVAWTPRLTRFLLSYIFEAPAQTGQLGQRKQTQSFPSERVAVPPIGDFFGPGISYEKLIAHIEALLDLQERDISSDVEVQAISGGESRHSSVKPNLPISIVKPAIPSTPLTREEMAKRLSALGRTSLTNSQD